jgi:hypothetical protein
MSEFAIPDRLVSIKDVIPSALIALGALSGDAKLSIPQSRHVIILLIDGLGEYQLQEHTAQAPIFQYGSHEFIATEFPSTTPVVLGSLGTGLSPGLHGLVGASFWVPEEEQMLAPLKWGSTPHPLSIAPDKTLFEMAKEAGVDVATIAPAKHQQSGLTRSVLRGPSYHGANSPTEILDVFAQRSESIQATQPALTYIYWPDLDRLGHVYGVGSPQWVEGLGAVNVLVAALVQSLASGESLVVTSDHGMITCPMEARISIEDHPSLCDSVSRIGGEPRVRHIYCRSGSQLDVQMTWKSILGDRAQVFTREECSANGLYHFAHESMAERIGDLVVISENDHMLTSRMDPRSSSLLGQHGALSQQEMYVPLRIFQSERGR